MIFSIFTYISFSLLLCFLSFQDVRMTNKHTVVYNNKFTVFSWLYILLFTIVSAFRFKLGADCEEYVRFFTKAHFAQFEEKGEYLFSYINIFLYNIGIGRVGFLGFWAFVEILFFYAALRTRKFLLPFVSLVLILGPHYYGWMNGIRQMVVICIFVYAMQQKIDNKRYFLYAFLILTGSFIHHSALILVVFLFIPNLDYFNNKYINRYVVIAAVLFSAVLGQQGWVKDPLNMAAFAASNISSGYERYTDHMQVFTEELAVDMGYGPRRLVILFVSLLIIWYYPKMKEYFNDKFLVFSFTVFVIFAIFPENILSSVHSSMSRPFMYFKPFKIICNAYLLYYLHKKIRKRPIPFFVTLVLSLCYMIIDNIAEANNPDESTLFKFIFTQN